jgi:hypothetical protein
MIIFNIEELKKALTVIHNDDGTVSISSDSMNDYAKCVEYGTTRRNNHDRDKF